MPADITRWEHMVNAQRLALEIVTNLCSVDDELPPMDDTVDLDDESVVTTATSESGVDVAIIQRIINTGFISRVLTKCVFPPAEIIQAVSAISSAAPMLEKLNLIQIRSLACLQNIILFMPEDELGDVAGIWIMLVGLCARAAPQPTLTEILSLSTSLMWLMLRKVSHIEKVCSALLVSPTF